jgi:hypothetical protein
MIYMDDRVGVHRHKSGLPASKAESHVLLAAQKKPSGAQIRRSTTLSALLPSFRRERAFQHATKYQGFAD